MDNFSLRTLVVDNDPVSRQTLIGLIEAAGQEALATGDGQAALGMIKEFRPEVLVFHPAPSAMDGIDLLRKIRSVREGERPYTILVAGPEHRMAWREDLTAGVDEFIDQPLNPEVVGAQLRAARRIIRLQRENARYQRELHEYSEELNSSNQRLRELAMTDDLTGLPNRRYSMELMQHEWAVASGQDLPLSCMVIDLDGLKLINDEQGLERGDVVIKTVAAIMKKYLPPQDVVCRISGDEFLVICPGASLAAVMARGEKLVSLVGSFNIHAEDHPLGLSIGVAERRPGTDDARELVNLAEQAMHYAKRVGKDQVISGHAMERCESRKPRPAVQSPKAAKRKSRKQFPLWWPAEALETARA